MAEPATPSPRPMGWQVPGRMPALVAGSTLLLVFVLLLIAGTVYRHTIGRDRYRPVHTFPAPGIETFIHDGQGDPPRPRPARPEDPAVAAAKRDALAGGVAWPR